MKYRMAIHTPFRAVQRLALGSLGCCVGLMALMVTSGSSWAQLIEPAAGPVPSIRIYLTPGG